MKSLIFILSIISTVRAVTFNCEFRFVESLNLFSTYSCDDPIVSNVNESENLTAVSGTHMSGKTNNDVKGLFINHVPHLTFIPRGIENFFPNLQALGSFNTSISTLNGDELEPFTNLYWFRFVNIHGFERVPGNLFSSNPSMRHVDFSNNNIKHVGENFLNNNTNMIRLEFDNNYCVNQSAKYTSIPPLIDHLRTNCTDIEVTTEEPSCGDFNEIICELQEQNLILMAKNEEMKEEIQVLNTKVDEMSTNMDKKLDEVLEGILELSTRPCGI